MNGHHVLITSLVIMPVTETLRAEPQATLYNNIGSFFFIPYLNWVQPWAIY